MQTPSSLRASTTMKSLRHLQSAEVQGEGSKDDTPSGAPPFVLFKHYS